MKSGQDPKIPQILEKLEQVGQITKERIVTAESQKEIQHMEKTAESLESKSQQFQKAKVAEPTSISSTIIAAASVGSAVALGLLFFGIKAIKRVTIGSAPTLKP